MAGNDDGGTAFPTNQDRYGDRTEGMSLRDYFAAQAAPAYIAAMIELSKIGKGPDDDDGAARIAALKSYRLADFMLEARKR